MHDTVVQKPPVTNAYFVFFKTQKAAAAAAQCSIFPEGAQDSFKVVGAPGPEEVPFFLAYNRKRHFSGSFYESSSFPC